MQTRDTRVTARIVRTDDGKTYHEYEVGGVAYGSLDALEAALNACCSHPQPLISPLHGARTSANPHFTTGDSRGRPRASAGRGKQTRTPGFDSPSGYSGWRPTAIESDDNRHTRPRNYD